MAKIESYAPGSFCWAELASPDPESAKRFYGEMFGWTANDFPMPEGVYSIFQSEGNDAAAVYKQPPHVPPHWAVYFSVPSAADTAAKAIQLGGKVIAPAFDVMEFGRMAVLQDPTTAVFCVWEPKQHIGATHGGPLNQVTWPELRTPDPAAAIAFYTELLGWEAKPSGGSPAEYTEWYLNGPPIGGLLTMKGDEWTGVPPHWGVYVTVADCEERAAKAASLGAQVCVPPTPIPNVGKFAVLNDPQGVNFSIIQLQSNG